MVSVCVNLWWKVESLPFYRLMVVGYTRYTCHSVAVVVMIL
jgi:hypothetical protein